MQDSTTPKKTFSRYILSALFGIIGGLLTIGTIAVLDEIIKVIWEQGFGMDINDPQRGVVSLAMLLIVGLIIGLLSMKFGPAKGNIESVVEDSLENGKIDWRNARKNVMFGLLSIGSGASLGPEAPAAMISGGTASFIAEKAKVETETSRAINVAAVSGMLGALLSSPFVGIAMIIESSKQHVKNLSNVIGYSLIAGSFGIATFFVLFNKLYSFNFGIPAYVGPTTADLAKAFLFGIIGALFAVIVGIIMKLIEPSMQKLDTKLVLKSIVGATVAGLIAVALPLTMFSGQHTMSQLLAEAATTGFVMLFLLALGKLLATAVLLRTGFFGGPIFPAIFAGAALGLAFSKFIDAPVALAIASTIAGMITVMHRQPLTAALITIAIVGTSCVAPVSLAVAAGLLVLSIISKRMQAPSKHSQHGS